MPRIIRNTEKRILNAAVLLFRERGYERVDMRMIAAESGLAVGTLYNYFSNKRQLFTAALFASWQDTLRKLKVIAESPASEDQLELFMTALYDGMDDRNGLGRELALTGDAEAELWSCGKSGTTAESAFSRVFTTIDACLRQLIDVNGTAVAAHEYKRAVMVIMMTIAGLHTHWPQERDGNIAFTVTLVEKIYGVDMKQEKEYE